ncbi:extracellular solute-binding protein [Paenibacillus sp. OV219]|uniref:extracellular solute-binding protein n=1 Tax=Paenibacillus sp. OV219 TaxID=1884377 RepID=UPI0008B460F1|nr:extracellular solute-binding protein [Paenibacillus sp. OV219]SEO94343.1 ABC-type glycerol-3-phosphate transport system, substrate-binding protein [Paenibacillus sp. OV219]
MKVKQAYKGSAALLLATTMVLVAGCGGNNANTSSNDSTKTNNAATTTTNNSNKADNSTKTDNSATTNNSTQANNANTSEPVEPAKEPTTFKVQLAATTNELENTDVYNEIIKQTGVTMKIETFDEEKFKVQLAGGDLPDIIQVQSKYLKQLIDGKLIIPLDDLVASNGPDIQSPTFEKSIAYSKQFWSGDTGKLYEIPVQVGQKGWGFEQTTGFTVRWDYYKELGYPKVESIDDMVNVLSDMVAKHPKTADGKKVYGTAIWNDWGTWGLSSMGLMINDGSPVVNNYTDTAKSGIWATSEFMYKAKQKGILDPDAFTAKYDDIVTKASQGTLLNTIATWPFQNVNAELLKQGPDKGYMTLPLDWGFAWAAGNTIAGWADRGWAISANCKDPQRAMDLINYLSSEQGSRLMESGIQGVHWDMVDGKPQMKPETVELSKAGGDAWKKTGIGMMANQQGLSDDTVLSDGGPVNLFNTPEVFTTKLNSLNKDYSDYYGVPYPAAAYKKYEDSGQVKSLNSMPQDVQAAMPQVPDDMKRIQTKLDDLITKGIPDIVLHAKNDADYKGRQQKLIDKLNKAGADEFYQWQLKAFDDTNKKFQ